MAHERKPTPLMKTSTTDGATQCRAHKRRDGHQGCMHQWQAAYLTTHAAYRVGVDLLKHPVMDHHGKSVLLRVCIINSAAKEGSVRRHPQQECHTGLVQEVRAFTLSGQPGDTLKNASPPELQQS